MGNKIALSYKEKFCENFKLSMLSEQISELELTTKVVLQVNILRGILTELLYITMTISKGN